MGRKKYKRNSRKYKKRGRGFHIFIVYFAKKTQKGTGAVSLLAKLLSNVVGGVIGL